MAADVGSRVAAIHAVSTLPPFLSKRDSESLRQRRESLGPILDLLIFLKFCNYSCWFRSSVLVILIVPGETVHVH